MKKYRNPIPTVDIIIEEDDKIVLIRRKNEPFKGKLAIPGGFVNEGELIEDRAIKEAKEENIKRENRRVSLKKIKEEEPAIKEIEDEIGGFLSDTIDD